MKQSSQQKIHSVFSVWNFLIFWGLATFTVSCCMILFISDSGISEEVIRERAPAVALNILVLSTLFTAIDTIRRAYTVNLPVKRILAGTQSIRRGNFSEKIEPLHTSGRRNEFDVIIDDLNTMAKELSGIETLRTDFISNVSHELKTPLAVIQNYSTLLQSPGLPEEKRVEYAKIMTDASRRLSDLITNILKLNKLENQQIYPDVKPYDLGEQLCECLLGFESQWEKKEINITADIAPDIWIEADAELLTLVWNNLFSNAIKFTEKGGAVAISLRADGDVATVQVRDTGCGIPPETGKHIFEKFYQGDTSHATQGNGLGLALVKRVVDIFGGEIGVESAVGKGSTFTVRLRKLNHGKNM